MQFNTFSRFTLTWLIQLAIVGFLLAQQVADTTFNPAISAPAYQAGKGPVVFIDQGHHNFHTRDGRYRAFARLLQRDGYAVRVYDQSFTRGGLDEGSILVVSNALNGTNVGCWFLPTPSAFSEAEIEVVEEWVRDGGSLFLIADHMPMAGAAADLAAAFGFGFSNGFVMDTLSRAPAKFSLSEGTLTKSAITRGRNEREEVDEVVTFTGQAFTIPEDATSILVFNEYFVNRLPDTAWVFNKNTREINAKGWSQGAYKKHGMGKIVVFGEAAMFTAQLAGAQEFKMGMNHPDAQQNYQLLLNIVHWLDGKLE